MFAATQLEWHLAIHTALCFFDHLLLSILRSTGPPPQWLSASVYPVAAPMCSMRAIQLSVNDALFCIDPVQAVLCLEIACIQARLICCQL